MKSLLFILIQAFDLCIFVITSRLYTRGNQLFDCDLSLYQASLLMFDLSNVLLVLLKHWLLMGWLGIFIILKIKTDNYSFCSKTDRLYRSNLLALDHKLVKWVKNLYVLIIYLEIHISINIKAINNIKRYYASRFSSSAEI